MEPTNKTARLAGLLYLVMGLPAPFSLIYVPNKLIVRGDPAATAGNILESETLFRTSIVAGLFTTITFIFLVMVLYRLLNGVNRMHASLMVILALVSVPVSLFASLNEIAVLSLLKGTDLVSAFDKPQLDGLVMLLLGLRRSALIVAQIFWGLWLFPFGLLVMRSGFLPRILGLLLIVNGFAYPVVSLTTIFLPDYAGLVSQVAIIPELGELWIILWLLIKGARVERPLVPAPA